MIEITYNREYHSFRADGHARSGEIGKDLVCAGCTTLVYTLVEALRKLHRSGALIDSPKVELTSGHASVSWTPSARMRSTVEIAVSSVICGFSILAAQYPEYVEFKAQG